jgi:hypothetical protein
MPIAQKKRTPLVRIFGALTIIAELNVRKRKRIETEVLVGDDTPSVNKIAINVAESISLFYSHSQPHPISIFLHRKRFPRVHAVHYPRLALSQQDHGCEKKRD